MSLISDDIIVGIATPMSKSAIGIIRISGQGSIELVNSVFKGANLTKVKSHTINYGHILNKDLNEVIDEVLVSVFRAPKTYTKEDIIEINCHGGPFIINRIYEELTLIGARPAEAGEFTKRAYLNGRIDLVKAESVMDMINAENRNAINLANRGLRGDISDFIKHIMNEVLEIITIISVNIDYPEYDDVEELTNIIIKPKINLIQNKIIEIIKKSKNVLYLKDGIKTIIIGKPNVGKSSLLNALLRENKAIVTNIPGTTRDVIETKVNLENLTLHLHDTAGIRQSDDFVERIGIERSLTQINDADLILLVFDGSHSLSKEDFNLIKMVENKNHLKIINKSDLNQMVDSQIINNAISISTYNKEDINRLEKAIINKIMIEDLNSKDLSYVSNVRHLKKMSDALEALKEGLKAIEENAYIDMVEISIRDAYNHLGEILGINGDEFFINNLFSRFCLGK